MANKLQIKRTAVSGRTPNTSNSSNAAYIDTAELAINLTDGKMFSSNGSVYFEVGANLQNLSVTGNATINAIIANGVIGTAGQVLFSNGSGIYWDTVSGSGTVTEVISGNGLTGGPITSTGTISVLANNGITSNSTGLFVTPGTGTVVNTTGVHVNSAYIGTLASNSATYLGGNTASDLNTYADNKASNAYTNAIAYSANATNISSGTLDAARLPASAVQNTDSRTLSGNLVISGTYFNPSANTILLGNSTQRWVISANTGDFTGSVTGTVANMSTSVNSALLTVGTTFIANSSAVVIANPLTANGTTGTAGQALLSNGASGSPYWGTVEGGGGGSGQFTPNVVSVANTATAVINVTDVDQYNITALGTDVTFSVSSTVTPDDGQRLLIRIRDNGTARNLTWTQSANQFRFIGITPPTITSVNKLAYIGCIYNAADSRWDVISSLQQP
jgi:hypothetical protein